MKNEYVWLREACQLYKFMHIWVCEHLPVQIIYAVLSVKGQWIPSEKFSPTSTISLHIPPSFLSLVWSGADTRFNHRPGLNEEDPEACGKVPGITSVDQEPTISCPSSGLKVPAHCQGHGHNILHAEALGRISAAAPDRVDICMHVSLLGPCRHVSLLEQWISYEHRGGGSKHLSSLTRRHFQMLCCCVPTQWYQVIKHPRGVILIFITPPTDGILIINWFSAISVWSAAQNSWLI